MASTAEQPTTATTAPDASVPGPAQASTEPQVGVPAEEEAQNALTAKFTDAEWKALKEFRTALPIALEEAFPETKSTFEIWGVTIDPSKHTDARASVILMKFLRARNLVVADAQTMLINTLKWRKEFKAAETANESFPEDVFGPLGHVYGKDKEGRPVTYNLYGANKDLKAVFGDVDRFLRWRVGLMEKGLKLIDFETVDSMVQVHDYEGVGLSSRDANSKRAASEATKIFQDHYPELLHKKFFVNVPTLMTWIFWLFKPLVSAQTLAKMSVLGSGPETIGKELLLVVGAEELPARYGGKAEAF